MGDKDQLGREIWNIIKKHEKFLLTEGFSESELLRVVENLEQLKRFIGPLEADRANMRNRLQELDNSIFVRAAEAIRRNTTARVFGSKRFNRVALGLRNLSTIATPRNAKLVRVDDEDRRGPLWPEVVVNTALRNRIYNQVIRFGLTSDSVILVKSGGMGDNIQVTPLAKALKRVHGELPVVAVVERMGAILKKNPYIDLVIEYGKDHGHKEVVKSLIGLTKNVLDVRYVSKAYGNIENGAFFSQNSWYYDNWPSSSLRYDELGLHVCDAMLASFGLDSLASKEDVRVTPDFESVIAVEKPFVVVSNSVDSSVGLLKKWAAADWTTLIQWLRTQGIGAVQLGVRTDALLSDTVIDLRGKTSPRQAAAYIKNSEGYVGVEGGLFHMSKAVGKPAVVIFASTSPAAFAYSDTFVVTTSRCRPCWWTPGWEVGVCSRGQDHCLNLVDWKVVAKAVERMLNGKNNRSDVTYGS